MPIKIGAFNGGRSLPSIKCVTGDGAVTVGILEKETEEEYRVFSWPDVLSVRIRKADVEEVVCPLPEPCVPALAFETANRILGGVGKHTRRMTYSDSSPGKVKILICPTSSPFHPEDAERVLHRFGASYTTNPPTQVEDGIYEGVAQGETLPCLVYDLALMDCYVYCSERRVASIFPDSLNRARHLWGQQLKYEPETKIGPTRASWRFRFDHLPPGVTDPPFSWAAWATIVMDQIEERGYESRIDELMLPLRAHVRREQYLRKVRREREGNDVATSLFHRIYECKDEEMKRELEEMAANHQEEEGRRKRVKEKDVVPISGEIPHYVLTNLTDEQSEEQFTSFYVYYYGHRHLTDDQKHVLRTRLLHAPLTTGHWPHWNTPYELSGRFVAFGDELRVPVREQDEVAFPSVRNRMRKDEKGVLKGRGSSGYKGIFDAPSGKKAYNPQRQLLRTERDIQEMRRPPI